jgi:hypothetical protein
MRLGNANTGHASTPWEAETEQATYTMNVSPGSTWFAYLFAIVLQSTAGGHTSAQHPFFQVTVKDTGGNQIGGANGLYYMTSADAANPANNFLEQPGCAYNSYLDVYYKKWTKVTVDLSAYIGQTVSIEFRTADCSVGGHFGYAYITASCDTTQIGIGLQESAQREADVKVYPNPASDLVFVEVPSQQKMLTVEIIDLLGHVVQAGTFSDVLRYVHLPIEKLAKGVYLVRVQCGGKYLTRKLIKD